MTSVVPVAVGAGLDHPGAHLCDHMSPSPVATQHPRNHALTVHHPALAYPPPTFTDDLTTTAPSAPNHIHDQLTTATNHVHDQLTTATTTATNHDQLTTATTTDTTATNHDQSPSRHWHPAVPATSATVPATGEGPGAAPC